MTSPTAEARVSESSATQSVPSQLDVVVQRIDGKPVHDPAGLRSCWESASSEAQIDVTVWRNRARIAFRVER